MNGIDDLKTSLQEEEQMYDNYDFLDPFSDTQDWHSNKWIIARNILLK